MTGCFIDSGLDYGIFLNSDISQGSVVTQLRCGEIISQGFVANSLVNLSVKEVWKSVNICRSYGQYCSALFLFDSQCISVTLKDWLGMTDYLLKFLQLIATLNFSRFHQTLWQNSDRVIPVEVWGNIWKRWDVKNLHILTTVVFCCLWSDTR